MSPAQIANPGVLNQPVYEPGRPIEDVARELGLDPAGIIKLASNENPLGPSPRAREAAARALVAGQLYPDGACARLRDRLSTLHDLPAEQFIVGNGSNEIIELLAHVFLRPGVEAVMATPAFSVYRSATLLAGATPVEVPLASDRSHDLAALARAITPRTRLVFVACPNNPTGTVNPAGELCAFARALPEHVVLVCDEAYSDFADNPPDLRPLIREGRKIVCLRTFSKLHGLAALRIGYGFTTAETASLLQRVRQPFNVNAIAQAAALAALDDGDFIRRSLEANRDGIAQLTAGFAGLGLEFIPSQANFLLVKVGDGTRVYQALLRRGLIVRPAASFGLPEWIRITVGTRAQNTRLLQALAEAI